MKFGHSVRCLLFDLGSTLWTHKDERLIVVCEKIANLQAVLELRRYTGFDVYPDADAVELGQLLRKSFEKQIRVKTRQHPEYEPGFILAAMEALQQMGVPDVTRDLGEAIYEALRVRIPDSRVLFDDTLSTLAALKERGYILGVVTNRHYGGAPFHEDLKTMGLLDYFDLSCMAISADLGIRKPHSDMFMHALNCLNVLPEEAAMIGDSLRADIAGAKRLNILAIWMAKKSLREEALAAQRASDDESEPVLTDDFLLAYTRRTEKRGRQTPEDVRPDAIIERLSDLLDVF
ncbi:MAG TPA: HAD family hydrolase [Ktedonobacteraceae bacterium]|nr:HAD family hydrolase [Ktedonobacteraceae bacterium]